ncbi:hypothetical protein [Frigidibacter oleivorans]|uniref:hypothetical protein n=1 Tax=Frigidibacter oleivorans TaxID=2487129 RepID=UPI000F8D5A5D|nr:hypothetical protein [Frigidibacter oleivorans]
MRRLIGILGLMVLALAGPGAAQPVQDLPPYDPGGIPWAPRLVTLPACGFAMGIDPVWQQTEGRPGRTADFDLRFGEQASARWDRHPLNPATVQPIASLTVNCSSEVQPKKDVSVYLDRFGAGLVKGLAGRFRLSGQPVIDTVTLADGPWRRIVLRGRDRQDQPYTWVFLLADRGGRSRWIMVQVSEDDGKGTLLPAETLFQIGLPGRGETRTRLLAPARRMNGKDGFYLRQARQARDNVAFAMRIAATIR